ncbi:MAG: 4Fe-4S dicluster domain-containing protein [Bradymonadales bacterium]|nr:MAG: 4Fe-4S dicluster domain-containing protein [Bradymonadales bacterium]
MNASEKELKSFRMAQEALLNETPRKLWKSVQEREESADQKLQRAAQEFVVLPKDQVSEVPETPANQLSRRQFFQWGAAATALMSSVACQRRPKDYLVPFVNKPEGYTYGVPVWYASSSPQGLGLLVKTREGRPIKVEGNPDHPGNQGALDARTQASTLDLYNPDRLKAPFDRKAQKDLSWEEVDQRVLKALEEASPGEVRILMEGSQSPTLDRMLEDFQQKFSARVHRYSALPTEAISRAYELLSDQRRLPFYRFDLADVVVSVNADFLGTWIRPVEFAKQFSKRKRLHEDDEDPARLFCFETPFSTTGVHADHRAAILPSHELPLLLGVAGELAKTISFEADLRPVFSAWSAERAAEITGVSSELIQETARALASARGRSLVVAGLFGPQSLELQLLAIAINQALGNMGVTVSDSQEIREISDPAITLDQLIADCSASQVKVLIVAGQNPVYSRPGQEIERAIKGVDLVVQLTSQKDETSEFCDLVLPESHFLEAWGDQESLTGLVSVQQPSIHPLFNSRSFGEALSAWVNDGKLEDYRFEVEKTWRENFYSGPRDFRDWWRSQLQKGVWEREAPRSPFRYRWTGATALLRAYEFSDSEGIELFSYESIQMGDGRHANNAWLQELPDPITKVVWTNYAAVSPAFAKAQNLKQGQLVDIRLADRQLSLPLVIQPGMREAAVAVAFGYGRRLAGRLGSQRGSNVFQMGRRSSNGLPQFSGQRIDFSPTSRHVKLASTQHHFDLHGRDYDILQHTTLAAFKKNPRSAKVELKTMDHPSHSMYPDHVYAGHRWGMTIDLNKCTGCQACVVACYSENNVSVVGPDQVEKGRHMAWVRLDLYYQGNEESPEAVYQPMLCQHCERAPCETVCPVLATVHSSDGLNDMIYNRCVGTRYCANNCPYKVRRFNYFDYSSRLAETVPVNEESPLSLMLNPDVTVRSRGVMEKCTFCVQRIRHGVDEIKAQMGDNYRHRIPDGHIKTACQQTCPADAIEFGDLNDPNSRVSQSSKRAQGFKVLSVLNTNPAVTYLPRVRHKGNET